MRLRVLAGLVVSIAMLPVVAPAQQAAPSDKGTLEFKQSEIPTMKGRRPVVRPVPKPDAAVRDAERAAAEYEAAERQAKVLRDARQPAARRPDLDYDVTSGIQQRAIQKSLRR